MRLLFDLLSSCSGLLKHAAATTPAAVTIPPLTFNVRQCCTPRVGQCSRCGTDGSRRDGSYCRGERHRRRPNRCSRCCALAERRDRPTGVTEPDVLDVVPLSVATGNVRVYFTALSYSHRLLVTLKQWPLPCEARQMVVNLRGRSADASRIVQARLPICAAIVTQFVTHFWWTSSLGPSHVVIAGVPTRHQVTHHAP